MRCERVWLSGFAITMTASAVGWCQTGAARSTARELAKEGLLAFEGGRYGEALEKLGEAYQVVRVPTLALRKARVLERLGRLVEASELYLEATRLSIEGADPVVQTQAQADAVREREALLPRLAKMAIEIDGIVGDGLDVTIDGHRMPSALFRA